MKLPPSSHAGLNPNKLEHLYYAYSLAGSTLLAVGGLIYRIDRVHCWNWPPLATGLAYSLIFLLALALLTISWLGLANLCIGRPLRAVADAPTLPAEQLPTPMRIMLLGLLVNLVALSVPPFLADDSLAYAAVGRTMFTYHRDMYTPLGEALPPTDIFRIAIGNNESWYTVGSAYSPGFNWLAYAVSYLAGDSMLMHLRLFQLISLGAALLTAVIAGQAAKEWSLQQGPHTPTLLPGAPAVSMGRQVAARAMALVMFCPLTLVEASNNAHNDIIMAVSVALFALFVVRRRPFWAFIALLIGPLIKASGLLVLGLYTIHLTLSRWQVRLPRLGPGQSRRLRLLVAGVAVGLTVLTVWLLFPWLERYSSTTARMLGSPSDKLPYCTRSIECLPRGFLHMVLGMPAASWVVGLCFRAAGGAFLLYMAIRSERGARHLTWVASFLCLYYLILHGYSQSWYLLSLLPLLSFADGRLRPVMLTMCVSNLAYYAIDFPFSCDHSPLTVGITEVLQGLIVVFPPMFVLIRGLRRVRRGSGPRRARTK